jgi:glycosyltransferase involved in cell wall biosynthesis
MGVTILVPTYNDSQFLVKNLKSCLSQSLEKEIIVIDDCSTVPFSHELNQFISQNPSIRVIRHEKNGGLSACRNTGIAASKYDFILPLDADDWLYPNVLPVMYDFLRNHSDSDVVYGNLTQDSSQVSYPVREITLESFRHENPLFGSSMYRKKIWEAKKPEYILDGRYIVRPHAFYEDFSFFGRACRNGFKFRYLDILVYNHTLRKDSMLMQLHDRSRQFKQLSHEDIFG